MSWMTDFMQKFSKAGDLVMDFCGVTCSKTKACMSPQQHRKFVGCNGDSKVLSAAESDVVLRFAFQMLSAKSHISESGEVEAATKVLTDELGALLAEGKATV